VEINAISSPDDLTSNGACDNIDIDLLAENQASHTIAPNDISDHGEEDLDTQGPSDTRLIDLTRHTPFYPSQVHEGSAINRMA
jgi:hypothetical protein